MKSVVSNYIIVMLGLAACGIFFADKAQAQEFPVSLSSKPQSPSPGEPFTITANTPLTEESRVFFRWRVNGASRPDLSGYGKKALSLVAGEVGTVQRVSVDALTINNEVGSAALDVIAADLALSWSAKSYVPAWYKGRALASRGSRVNVAAVPEIILGGARIEPERLLFSWKIDNGEEILSGVGEDRLEVQMSTMLSSVHRVSVLVEDLNKRIKKEVSLFIKTVEPRFIIYPSQPLGGIEPRTSLASSPVFNRGTLDFEAEPFFFLASSKKDLRYSWTVGGTKVPGSPAIPYFVTIHAAEAPAKAISLFLAIEQLEGVGRFISKSFAINLR